MKVIECFETQFDTNNIWLFGVFLLSFSLCLPLIATLNPRVLDTLGLIGRLIVKVKAAPYTQRPALFPMLHLSATQRIGPTW